MPKAPFGDILQYLRSMYPADDAGDRTDGALLNRFVTMREEGAFTVLVQRHGPMVLGVCQRLLGDLHLAEDAFQATFIVLARRAASIGWQASVGNWLYAVAQRVAMKAKAKTALRRIRERESRNMPRAERLDEHTWQELRSIIDEEISRLPPKYQAPLVLCHLEGKSHDRAAKELGCAKTTLERRLSRGRELLRQQFIKRGITLSAGMLATVLCEKVTAAPLGATLTIKAVKAAGLAASGKAVAAGFLTARALALAEEAMAGMVGLKAKLAVMVLAAGLAVGGAGWAGYLRFGEKAEPPKAERKEQNAIAGPAVIAGIKQNSTDLFGDPLPQGALLRLGTVRLRHHEAVWGVAFSPDGEILASVASDGVIRLWDPTTGRPIRELRGSPVRPNLCVAFSPDGSKLATGAGDGDVRLWNVRTGKMLFEKQGHKKQVSGLAFAPDGLSFASAGGNVRVWNASTGAEMLNLQPPGNDSLDLQGVAFSPNGKLLAAGRGKAIHIWDAATGTSRLVIPKVNSLFYFRIAFFDDKILLSNDKGGRVRFWDITTGKQVREFNAGEGLVLSPNGKLLASTHRDKIAVLDIKTGETIYEILDYYNRFGPTPNHLAISPDGKTLAAQTDHAVRVWDLATGKPRLDFRDSHTDRVHSAAFSPDGRQVLTGAGDGTARLWDAATAKQLRVFNLEKKDRAVVTAAAFSPDRKWIAAGGYDKSVGYCTVWDAATAKELRTQGFPYGVTRLAFSPDGQNLAVAAVTIYVWDFSTGKEPLTVTKRQKDIVELAFAPDGKTLTSVEQGSLHLWDVATKKQQAELALPEFGHAAISADGKKIVFSEGRPGDVLFVREIATGQNLRTIKVKDTFGSTVALSPDGRMLASCNANIMCMVEGYDYSIHLWEIVTGREVLQVQPGFTVRTLAFSADGQALISGLNNGTALIWNLKTVTPRMAKSASPQDLERLWAGLADDNAAKAHQALWTLVVTPKETVLFLQHLLKPVPLADQNIIRQWIADLDSDKFTIRQTAAKELEKIGDQVKAPIENAMKGKITLETRRRLEHILNNLPDVPGPGAVRNIRAIMALERIASSEAQGVLEALARGAPGARETEEAKGSLDRLKLRASRMP